MKNRVVVTGLGVVAPNAANLTSFEKAIREGKSGIRHIPELEKLHFGCTVGGIPPIDNAYLASYFNELTIKVLKSSGIIYGCIAAMDAWKNAALDTCFSGVEESISDAGCVFGSGLSGVEPLRDAIYDVDAGNVRRLGSRVVEQTMASGPSAYIGGILGLGNWVTTNSSACSTGSEAVLMAAEYIRAGKAKVMLAGSCDSYGPYIWGGFDSMRVLNRAFNDRPEEASRPMSADATGFVPGAGAGALILEDLEHALARNAIIYAEILGGAVNSGGQRNGGTMTAPNSASVRECIRMAMDNSGVQPSDIDAVCGHLTSTMGDVLEIRNWSEALGRSGTDFPYINALKSMIGHCLAAAGSIELVAACLQLDRGFFHGTLNAETLHPGIEEVIVREKAPLKTIQPSITTIGKSSFGFGDVNCVVFLRKYY